jgi:PAS domain S-box-containing protein
MRMDLNRLVADAILAAAADVVVATDRDGIIQVWNPGAERIFGHRADEALGQSLDLIPERLRARHWEHSAM